MLATVDVDRLLVRKLNLWYHVTNWNWKKETGNLDYFILYTLCFILYFILYNSSLFVRVYSQWDRARISSVIMLPSNIQWYKILTKKKVSPFQKKEFGNTRKFETLLFVEGFFEAITSAFFPSKLWRFKPFLSIANCIFCLASLDDTKDEQPCASAPYFTLSGPKSGNLSRTDLNYVDRAKERVL